MATQKKRKARPSTENQKLGGPVASQPAYPGFKHWRTKTSRPKHANLSETSAYDSKSGSFVQQIKVKHSDAFRLRPLTFTEGPLKGHHILLLEPSTEHFPFLELPAEIRQMIYDECFLDDDGISISQLRRRGHTTRAVSTDRFRETSTHWDKNKETWVNKPPSALGLMTVNKQIHHEVASTLYGNEFKFCDFTTCQTFLENIGTMRSLLRDVSFGELSYKKTKARSVFFKLREAKRLRSLAFDYNDVSSTFDHAGGVSTGTFASDCKTMMVSLHKSRVAQDDLPDVLDLVHLTWEKCLYCQFKSLGHGQEYTAKHHPHGCRCDHAKVECAEVQKHIRKSIARSVGVEG